MAAHQAPPSLGLSRQEHWSGLPFPSPMHKVKSESESKVAQSCLTLSPLLYIKDSWNLTTKIQLVSGQKTGRDLLKKGEESILEDQSKSVGCVRGVCVCACMCGEKKKEGVRVWFILRHWPTWLWGLAFLNLWARLETQERADVMVLSPKSAWRQNFFILGRLPLFLLRL